MEKQILRIIKVSSCSDCPHCSYDGSDYDCFIENEHYAIIKAYPEPNDNCPIKPTEIENEILINNIELASDLAHDKTLDEWIGRVIGFKVITIEADLWDGENYKPQIQDTFNKHYDYFRNIIDEKNLLT